MNIKRKIAIGLGIGLFCLLVAGGVVDSIQGMTPVWAKVKLDTEMDLSHCLYANYCDGKIYYPEYGDMSQIAEVDVLSGEKKVITLNWNEDFGLEQAQLRGFAQVAAGTDGCIYGIVVAYYDRGVQNNWIDERELLCKFTAAGELVYATDVTSQIRTTKKGQWSSIWGMEVDGKGRVYLSYPYKLFLYDENGNYDKCIDVNPEESLNDSQIFDMSPGRDGNVYLYLTENSYRLVEVDYETGELVYNQDLLIGDLFCYDYTDGFYVNTSESLYHYATDLPTVGRVPEKLFEWWDLLIYKDNVEMIAAPKEDCILVVVSSSLEESRGAFLIKKMPKWEAEEGEYTYVEIP